MNDLSKLIGQTNPSTNWVELFAVLLAIIGFIISLIMENAFTSYGVILLVGVMTGRIIYLKKNSTKAYLILITGLIAGYLIGVRYGTVILNLTFFLLGNVISYMLHKKGLID